MEMHYDVSGPEADEIELKVWRISNESVERIHQGKGAADGYYEQDFNESFAFRICFMSLDNEEKDLSFMINQVSKGKVAFAEMDHVE